jgi:thermitase
VRGPRAVALLAALSGLLVPLLAAPAGASPAPPQRTWHADQIRAPEARSAGRDGDGVLVAVLDSWVDAFHRDFEGRVVTGADCTGGTCREGAPAPDRCMHGTHVAGTVASSSYGVAPRARVLPVKVLAYVPPGPGQREGSCNGTDRAVAAGIRYAVGKGARVLNLSLGTQVPGLGQSSAITAAVGEAARAGAVVVFAAGNSSVPLTDSYGGSALIVAATGPEGRLARYSQRGSGVALAAPGGDPPTLDQCSPERCVTSVFPDGRYAVAAGTSMAAPHVAGVAALLFAQDPGRTRQGVVDRLRSTARPLPGGEGGDGLVDAAAALSSAPAPAPPPGEQPAPPGAAATAQPGAAGGDTEAGALPQQPPLDGQGAPVEPEALPGEEPPPEAATAEGDGATDAAAAEPALPAGPPALALALILAAGLSTATAGLRIRTAPG